MKLLIQAQSPQPPCLSAKPVALLICETRPPTCHTSTVLSSPLHICNACETSHTSTAPSTPLLICKTCRTAYLRNPSPYLSHKHSPLNSLAYLQRLRNFSYKHSPLNLPAYLQNLSHCLSAKLVPLPVTQAQSPQVRCLSATPVKPLIQAQPPQPPCLSAKPVALLICETRPPTYHTSTVLSSPLLICNACETSHTSTVPSTPCLSAKPVALLICETRPPTYHTSTVLSSPLLICNACETSHTSTAPSTPLLICKTCRTACLRNPSPS